MREVISGIYCIENKVNGKKYIGQSADILQRLRKHKECLLRNEHKNQYLQNSWNKYGEFSFEFDIVEQCSEDETNNKEIYYIEFYKSMYNENGYNIEDGGNHPTVSQETREKISQANRNRIITDETREKLKIAFSGEKNPMFGKTHSPEIREKISVVLKGKEGSRTDKKYDGNSIYHGVCFIKNQNIYYVQIGLNGENVVIGRDKDEIMAARLYDFYLLKNKINRTLNFPSQKDIDETIKIFEKIKKGKSHYNSSLFYGVSYHKKLNKWQVSIVVDNKNFYVGIFVFEEDAAKVYDSCVINNNLDRPLNFPEDYQNA